MTLSGGSGALMLILMLWHEKAMLCRAKAAPGKKPKKKRDQKDGGWYMLTCVGAKWRTPV
jgi:hypothetical protein